MTRSGLRNITILVLICMLASGVMMWLQVRKAQDKMVQLQSMLDGRQNELNNLNFLVAAQDKLDTLTMDERRSTQLDVLRYLGLQNTLLDFRIDSRESRAVGDTNLIVRTVTVQAKKPYAEVMTLIDKLFSSGKFTITMLNIQRGDETIPEHTSVVLRGRLFSLQKQGEIDNTAAQEDSRK